VRIGRGLTPFLVLSLCLHVGLCFFYVRAVRGARLPFPKSSVYKVSLVELPPPEPVVEKKEPEPPKEEKPTRIPETPRPRKPEKKKEAPKEEKKEDPPAREETPRLRETTNGPVRVEAEDFPFAYYLALIENRVGGNWAPPKGLVAKGKPPTATVRFEVLRDGRIRNPHVTVPSGLSFFDLSALRAVLDSEPLPPLPDAFAGERLGVNFVFRYEG